MSLEDRQQVHEKHDLLLAWTTSGTSVNTGSQETDNMCLGSHYRGFSNNWLI